jgi:hypothetical protein
MRMENKTVKQEDMDLLYRLRKPISYAKAIAMVGFQAECYSKDKKEKFGKASFLKKLLCYPDTYHWKIGYNPENKKKVRISIVHDVHKELVFNLYKGDLHGNFDLYFDDEDTAYSILIKPVHVDDIDWRRRQYRFLFEFYPYFKREVKIRNLEIESPLIIIGRAQDRALQNLVNTYLSFLRELANVL